MTQSQQSPGLGSALLWVGGWVRAGGRHTRLCRGWGGVGGRFNQCGCQACARCPPDAAPAVRARLHLWPAAAVDDARVAGCLAQHAQRIVQGALRLVQQVLAWARQQGTSAQSKLGREKREEGRQRLVCARWRVCAWACMCASMARLPRHSLAPRSTIVHASFSAQPARGEGRTGRVRGPGVRRGHAAAASQAACQPSRAAPHCGPPPTPSPPTPRTHTRARLKSGSCGPRQS